MYPSRLPSRSSPRQAYTARVGVFLALGLAAFPTAAVAQERDAAEQPADSAPAAVLKSLSVEELMNVVVTSVSRRAEPLSHAASAIQVITHEDIRRSGATSLPEALRLATNLHVAQVDSRQWAIGARGFNGTTTNKLLVLIDGRTVYTRCTQACSGTCRMYLWPTSIA